MNKQAKYEAFLPQLQGLIDETQEAVSVMANVCAALHAEFGWWWTGFYLVRDKQLRLGPFQGSVVRHGNGVRRSSYRMWSCFQVISPAAVSRGLRLWYRSSMPTMRS